MTENTNHVTQNRFEEFVAGVDAKFAEMMRRFDAMDTRFGQKLDGRFSEFEARIETKMDIKLAGFAGRIEIHMEDLMDAKIEQLATMTRRGFIELREYVDSRFDAL